MNGKSRPGIFRGILIAISLCLLPAAMAPAVLAAASYHRVVRAIETPSFPVPHPAGLAYVTDAGYFAYLPASGTGGQPGETLLMRVGFADDPLGTTPLSLSLSNPFNIAYNPLAKKLLLFDDLTNELIEYSFGGDKSMLASGSQQRFAVGHFGLAGAGGMTVDPGTGDLFILDPDVREIVRVRPGTGQALRGAEGYQYGELRRISLRGFPNTGLRGLAFNPADGHLYVLQPGSRRLFEFSMTGQAISVRDLSGVPMQDPRGMVFAPSGDRTDDPANTSLYLADSGLPDTRRPGQIIEISLAEPVFAAASVQSSLIRIIDTSLFYPPSPDPAGLAWQIAGGRFFFSDSEVNEMSIFTGDNLFEMTTGGSLFDSMSTMAYSNEPTGLAFNTVNGHLFVSDDNARRVNEVDPGGDGLFGTPDDQVTSFNTLPFDSDDPEGVAFDSLSQTLFIVDGVNSEVYILRPGGNGVFDGVPPGGDDQLSQFDTAGFGITDPEGIEFNDASGHLYLVGNGDKRLLAEVTPDGIFVQGIDITAANARAPSGLARGPSSLDPQEFSIYISDRGVDNGENPNENDGKIYEMYLPPSGPDEIPPTVTAFDLPATATSLTVTILAFSATDNVGVTGFLATETSSEPAFDDSGWSASPPVEHTFAVEGSRILYGWAKDEAGNVSTALSDTVVITLGDTTPPVVTGFDLPDIYDSLTVPILMFTATDNVGVTGYLATETSTEPAFDDPGWSAAAPIAYTFAADGIRTLYGWAKDASGNVSAALSDTVTITLADTTVPVVSAFDLPATSSSLTVPILTFTATDNVGVTGYLVTESATTPSAGAPGWTATVPTSHTFASEGTKTLYGWARDAAGNVSASRSDTVTITLPDTTPPVIIAFDLPATSSSLTVPILTFTASDNVGVTSYMATESATAPSAGAPGWTAAAPTSYTFASEGTKTLYGWAKDAAGNVSAAMSDTVVISTGSGQQQVLEKRVAASSDDAEESRLGSMDLTSSDLELGTEDGNPQTVGMRFAALAIPQGATITDAYIQFTVDEADSVATSVVFRGQAADNAPTFTTTRGNITSRPQTAAGVSWSPVPWTVVGLSGPDQRTPNLAPIIQEIVNRSGWVQGNSLMIMISGSGERTAESYEGQAQSAPLLHVVYQTGGSGSDTTPPVVTAFDLPAASDSLTIPIVTFAATDDIGVTGYLATEISSKPAADNPGWSASPPVEHTFAAEGTQTLYGWAKDAAGNVSASMSDTVVITLPDETPPVVTAFDLPATYDTLTVPILTFTATDDTDVTGYLATETATAPAADAPGWQASAPIEYTFASEGSHTLYGWAKDAAGNVSAALSDTVVITLLDTTPPLVTAFDLPESSDSLTVSILTFTATDDTGVTGYLATESATAPSAGDPGWASTAPTSYTFAAEGTQTLYGWAKDAAGNVSASLSDTVVISLPDTVPPVVTAFDLPTTSGSLTVPIVTFTASDDTGVTGFLATESASAPSAGAPGWTATAPTSHTFSAEGSQTLYGWAKDAAGNVSTSLSDTVVISLPDTVPPVVTAFDLPASSDSLTVSILAFSATDDTGVTGYLATESATAPSAGAAGWTSTPPTSHTFTSEGSQTLYGWAKDAAGNVSASLSDTVVITLPDAVPPEVTAFDLPATSDSLTVPIVTFTATDDTGVTGYLATESATAPSAGAPGWTSTPPTSHTFTSEGSQTLYGWAKDAAGNVSASLSDTVVITLPDVVPPVVTAFDLPASSDSLTVPILTFTATDDTGVTGFLATESATAPSAGAPGWTATAPTSHTFSAEGSQTLYGWAKDAAGNVSAALSDTVVVTLPDTVPPVVTAFDLPASSTSLTVPIMTFTATDDTGVTGFLATESATAPSAGAPGWTSTAPTSYTFGAEGSQTLYGWAKDAAGNVSASLSDTVVITLPDGTSPVVTAFDLPASSTSLTVPILSFTATDDTGVTGYLATESATAPSAGAPGWTATAPTSHTFSAEGSQTLYGWAKDAAGNVSASLSDTVVISLPDTVPPVVTAFDLPASSTSLTVSILAFTATDDTGVTGFLATESATVPSAGAPGWTSTPPTSHTFASEGSQTLYGWARDAAGNVSVSLRDTVVITLGAVHVGDLDGSARLRGKSGKWDASVTVTVHDQNHNPVVGAVVSGAWSGDASGTVSGVTDGEGHVVLSTGNLNSGSTVILAVTGVSHVDFNYDAASNHDPDGDSNGTTITVIRP